MIERAYAMRVVAAIGLLSLGAAGCGPPEAGTIEAPVIDRTKGPTVNPNDPGGDSVIPAEDRTVTKGARRTR